MDSGKTPNDTGPDSQFRVRSRFRPLGRLHELESSSLEEMKNVRFEVMARSLVKDVEREGVTYARLPVSVIFKMNAIATKKI